MEIVQIVLDKKLLHAADQAAKRTRRNRSALVRDALREHLRRLELRASEERDRQGYSRQLQAEAEARVWEAEATWPVTSTIRGVPSEVVLNEEDGMKSPCAVNLHNAVTVSQQRLGKRVAQLSAARMSEVCAALRFSLGCDSN